MAIIWLLLLPACLAQLPLQDGIVCTSSLDSPSGGNLTYQFFLNSTLPGQSLFVTTTTFSDWASPEVYISAGIPPSKEAHDYAASPTNMEEIEIPGAELRDQTNYFILILCQTYCRFSIVASLNAEIRLSHGSPLRFTLDKDQEQAFTYEVTELAASLTFLVTPLGAAYRFDMHVIEGGPYGEVKDVTSAWPAGKSCFIPSPKRTTYWLSVIARENLSFLVAGRDSNSIEELIASRPTYSVVGKAQWQYYKLYIDDGNATVYVSQTVYSGEFAVYIKAWHVPSEISYDILASGADNETISIDKHQRETFGVVTGWYYIGILGTSPSAFILTASINENGMVPLYPGVQYSGFVDLGENFYFYMDIPPQSTIRVSVKAQAASGDLSVYMKLCNEWILSEKCKISTEELEHRNRHPEVKASQGGMGFEEVAFLHGETECGGSICRYAILVQGKSKSRSNFIIVTSFDDSTEHSLRNGIPMAFSLPKGQSMFFRHRVVDERVVKVSFSLTIFSGNCSTCISPYVSKPLPPLCLKYSDHRLDPHEQTLSFTKGLDLESLNSSYYLTVRSPSSCSFSLLTLQTLPNTTSVVRLFPGQAQRDKLYEGESIDRYRVYSFQLAYTRETMKDVDVRVMQFGGVLEVVVGNDASGGVEGMQETWKISGGGEGSQRENSLHIATSDPAYLPCSTYLLLVRVTSWPSSSIASYSLLFTSGDGSMTLQTGMPLSDMVAMGQYRYYELPVRNEDQSVTVVVSAETGDPDLYVGVGGWRPSKEKHDEASVNYGSEVLTLLWLSRNHTCSDQSCHLSISVFGYTDSTYSIVATIEHEAPIYVVPGVPQVGKSELSEYRFYYTVLNTKQWFQASVESFVGEATLFLNLLAVRVDSAQVWTMPTLANHQFQSEQVPHSTRISLQAMNLTQVCGLARCRADLSVRCETENCRFSLSVTQSDELLLTEGSPQYGLCTRAKPVFFKFYNNKDSTNIIVRVAGVTSGDPDLYMSKGVKPETNSSMWKSVSWGDEFLEIPVSDQLIGPSMMKGEFYLLVLCDRDMTFLISVSTNPKALIRLTDGQPHSGYLHGPTTDYFYYPSALPSDIVVSLTVTSGIASIFAIMSDDREEDIYEKLPNATMHYWESGVGSITISQKDSRFCTSCNLLVSVVNVEYSCLYTLLVRNQGHITSLLNGQPFEGRLSPLQSRKYVFQHFSDSSLDISLSPFSGSPLMSVSTTPLVSQSTYNWTTTSLSQHLHILSTDPAFHKGLYYILVYSEEEAVYSLTAHSEGSVVKLVDGWAQTYSCRFGGGVPLFFEYITNGSPGTCKVVSLTTSFSPSVYGQFTDLPSSTPPPTPLHSDRAYYSYDMFYQMKMELWEGRPGKYIFAVYGNATKGGREEEMGDFQIFCLSANREKVISLGEVEYGVLDTDNQVQVFKLHIPRNGTLSVVATPCVGKLELAIKSSDSASKAEIKVKRIEDGRITADFPCSPSLYLIYISVLEAEELTQTVSFQLTTLLSSPGQADLPFYYPGNSGLIDWTQAGDASVMLVWSPPEMKYGDTVSNLEMVKYRVYATVENVTLASACGMDVHERMGKAWLAIEGEEEYGETKVMVEVPVGVKVWLNVLAIVDPEVGRDIYHVPYTAVEVFLEDKRGERRNWEILEGLAGVVLLLLVIILILTCKYMKAKKVQMQLVDMLDVETITKDFNKSLKSSRSRASAGFTPVSQDSSLKDD